MAENKDDPGSASKLTQSKKATQTQGAAGTAAHTGAAQDRGGASESSARESPAPVAGRKQRYLIGFRALPGLVSMQPDPFLDKLTQVEGVEVIRRLRANGSAIVQSEVVVARIDERLGEALRRSAPPHVVFEWDTPLSYSHMTVPELMGSPLAARAMPYPRPRRELRVRVLGEGEHAIPNAVVNLYGPGFPAQAITDASGQASLQTDAVDASGTLAIHVRPAADYWERYIHNPALEFGQVNVIRVNPLERTPARFSGERPYGWGQRIMRFDRAPGEWTGAGVKIGIIDSGCDNSHPQLRHIVQGIDLTRERDAQGSREQDMRGWRLDELAHGTHCAGTIAAADASQGMIGCAPAAEVHVFKVVPGGYSSDLIEALNQCIARDLDIVQIGVGSDLFSELVAQKITEARLHGVACVAAAGNSGGAVQFPGNVPGVLTVSAVGKLGEYPQDTRHAQRALPQLIGPSGIYATNFSNFGPQIGVCAPGVAIISSVPGGGYAAWDGSSMAAAHVVGLSALLLAHHPMLQSVNFAARAEQRVSMLFDMLRVAAVAYAQVDPNRVGAGLPDLQQVPGLSPANPLFANQQLYGLLGGSLGMQSALTPPAAFLADSMSAILRG
jgi:subtilisin